MGIGERVREWGIFELFGFRCAKETLAKRAIRCVAKRARANACIAPFCEEGICVEVWRILVALVSPKDNDVSYPSWHYFGNPSGSD